jgi:methyl-accepting chemotaxis protein
MSEEQNGHGLSRLDRMERVMEFLIEDHVTFRDEHKSLLTSQVLLTGQVDKLAKTTANLAETTANLAETTADLVATTGKLTGKMDQLAETMKEVAESQKELAEAQKHTDQRMDALIAVVDGMIRKPPDDSITD